MNKPDPMPESNDNDPAFKANTKLLYDKGVYALTINPDDKHQFVGKPDRLSKFRNMMYESLLCYSQYGIQYTMWIEISEPDSNVSCSLGPRLHLHGILKFCSKKAVRHFLLTEFYKLTRYSVIKLKPIDNIDQWLKYCTKQQHIMDTPMLSSSDGIIDHNNINLLQKGEKGDEEET